MYQPYPGGSEPQPPVPDAPAAAPPPVQSAVKLMYGGAAISALSLIVALVTIKSLERTLHRINHKLTATQVHSGAVFLTTVDVVIGLIAAGLWFWMARTNLAGKSWARVTSTVFFGLFTVYEVLSLRDEPPLTKAVTLLLWLIGLAAIVLIWRRPASEYYNGITPAKR